ncbi:MAG: AI-2E family transporter [Bdellovibrionia bacterium]
MSEERKNRTTLITFIALLLIACAVNVWMLSPYLLSVLMGIILSLMFRPLYGRLREKKLSENLAALVTVLAIIFLVIGPLTVFSVRAFKQAVKVGEAVADNPDFSLTHITQVLSEWGPVDALIEDPVALETQIRAQIKGSAQAASGLALRVAAQIPNLILQFAIMILTCYFVLTDSNDLRKWLGDKIPLEKEVRKSMMASFKDTAVSVIWATVAAAAAQSALIMIGFIALGIPNIALAGGATFIFAWIPMIGCTPVWVAGAAYLYFQGAFGKMIAMIVIGLVAGIIDNFIRPMVLKGRSSIHPLVSLVAIFGGIQMFGLLGVFVGPIVFSILINLMNSWPEVSRRSGLNFSAEK